MCYCHFAYSDSMIYLHKHRDVWGINLSNPISTIWWSFNSDAASIFNMSGFLVSFLLVAFSLRVLGRSYWLAGVMLLVWPLFGGWILVSSILRYIVVAFPVYMALAKEMKTGAYDDVIMVCFAILQCFLFIFWTTWTGFIV
jgi:hypothetical protein